MSDEAEVYPLVIRSTGNDTQILYDLELGPVPIASSYQLFIPSEVDLYNPNDSTDSIQYTRDENTSEYEGDAITVTSISSDEIDLKGMVLRVLPEAQVGDIIYIKPQSLVSQIMDEQFPEGIVPGSPAFDYPWIVEDVDPENFGDVSNDGDGQMNIVWSDVPYAFKRSFPAYPTYSGGIFGGEDGYIKNITIHIGALGEISQEMAEAFESGGREDAYVPSVVYFGLQVIGALSSNSIYIILAHTELPEDFASGTILSGPTKNVLMLLAPENTSIMNLTPYNDFLGGGATDISLVGPSGIGEDGDFDPIVFSETPAPSSPNLYAAIENSGYFFLYNKSNLSGGSWVNYSTLTDSDFIASDNDYIYIAEEGTLITKLSASDYSHINTFDISGVYIAGIAVDDTALYITDSSNHRVVKLDKSTGAVLAEWGEFTYDYESTTGMQNPNGIAVDDSYVYVADKSLYRIVVLTKSLVFSHQIGNYNVSEQNYFNQPVRVATNSTNLFVSDGNYIIFKFTPLGSKLVEYDFSGHGYPISLTADDSNLFLGAPGSKAVYKRTLSDLSAVSDSLAGTNPFRMNDISI